MCDVTRGGLTMEDGSRGLGKRRKNTEQNVLEKPVRNTGWSSLS